MSGFTAPPFSKRNSTADVPQTSPIVHRILNLYISQKEIAFCSVDEACEATCDFFKPGLDGSALSIKRPANSILLSNTHAHDSSEESEMKMFANSQTCCCTFILQRVSCQWKNIIPLSPVSFSIQLKQQKLHLFIALCCTIFLLFAGSN